jgi:hypothetical protein
MISSLVVSLVLLVIIISSAIVSATLCLDLTLFVGDVLSAADLSFKNHLIHIFVYTFNTLSSILIYLGMMYQFKIESLKYSN